MNRSYASTVEKSGGGTFAGSVDSARSLYSHRWRKKTSLAWRWRNGFHRV